jgi:hypothetical protein
VWLTPRRMDGMRETVMHFSCDRDYNKGHKCGPGKLFYIKREEEEDREMEPSQGLEPKENTPTI